MSAGPTPACIDKTLDARGLECPLPLLKTKQQLAAMASGERLELWASDPGSWEDISSFAALSEHILEQREQVDNDFHFILRKG